MCIHLSIQPSSGTPAGVVEERPGTYDVLLADNIDVSTTQRVPADKGTDKADSLLRVVVVRACLGGVKMQSHNDLPAPTTTTHPNPHLVHTCLLEENDLGRQFVVQHRSQCYLEYVFHCTHRQTREAKSTSDGVCNDDDGIQSTLDDDYVLI